MNPLLEARSDSTHERRSLSTWSLLTMEPDTAVANLRQSWCDLLAASDDPFGFLQSPDWFDLTRAEANDGSRDSPSLAIRRDSAGELVGVVPLYPIEEPCVFPIGWRRSFVTRPRKMIRIPSGRLLLPAGERWYDGLFKSLARRRGERRIVKVSNVPDPSPLKSYIETSPVVAREYCVFVVPGFTEVHTIPLPATYDEFLARYTSKKRYNLRRQIRKLEEHATGGLKLRLFDSEETVSELFNYWDQLSAAGETPDPPSSATPRAAREDRYRLLARAGRLCSYILLDGTRPIAGCLGHCHGTTFMLGKTQHDPNESAYSPGSCLLHMVIEQLIRSRSIRLINMGYGSPSYDYRATNVVLDFVSYWLIPRTWRTRAFQITYSAFRRGVTAIKSGLLARAAAPVGDEEEI